MIVVILGVIAISTAIILPWYHKREEQYNTLVNQNLAGICDKEMRTLSKEELYEKTIVDHMRNMLEDERKQEKEDHARGWLRKESDKLLMSSRPMTRDEFIKRVNEFKINQKLIDAPPSEKLNILGMERVLTAERFAIKFRETNSKLIVIDNLETPMYVFVFDYDNCCAVLTEEETKAQEVLFPNQDPVRKGKFDPEIAKKRGYGLHYLKLRVDHISMYKGQYELESSIYYPISNCGDVFYDLYLCQETKGTPIN
jgi:hypothetical protein